MIILLCIEYDETGRGQLPTHLELSPDHGPYINSVTQWVSNITGVFLAQ